MLRMSTLFLRTLREDPADAEVPSHRLLVRAGYVRRVAPGIYSWLPLGLRGARRRRDASCARRWTRSARRRCTSRRCCPRELYEATGRWTEYGDLLFRLQGPQGRRLPARPDPRGAVHDAGQGRVLAPTRTCRSSLYQIQTKYRDEARPRAGVLRGREFLMKDSYSFDLDRRGAADGLRRPPGAYERIFERLGLDYRIVCAVSGAMGGSASEEFLAPAPTGEDTVRLVHRLRLRRQHRGGRDRGAAPSRTRRSTPALEVLDTPDTPDHRDAGRARCAASATTSTPSRHPEERRASLLRHPDGRTEPLVVGVPGDREVDLKRLEANVSPAEVLPVDGRRRARPGWSRATSGRRCWAARGAALPRRPAGGARQRLGDRRQRAGPARRHVVVGRDFEPSGVVPAAEVRDGRPVRPLRLAADASTAASRSATSSSSAASSPTRSGSTSSARTASRSGSPWARTASASRARWPRSPSSRTTRRAWSGRAASRRPTCTWSPIGKGEQGAVAERLAAELEQAGLTVLLDDRGGSPGVAFKDAELLGDPDRAGRRQGAGRRARRGPRPRARAPAAPSRSRRPSLAVASEVRGDRPAGAVG